MFRKQTQSNPEKRPLGHSFLISWSTSDQYLIWKTWQSTTAGWRVIMIDVHIVSAGNKNEGVTSEFSLIQHFHILKHTFFWLQHQHVQTLGCVWKWSVHPFQSLKSFYTVLLKFYIFKPFFLKSSLASFICSCSSFAASSQSLKVATLYPTVARE